MVQLESLSTLSYSPSIANKLYCYIFLYADDVILLAPSVHALQLLVNICDCELKFLDTAVSATKSSCTCCALDCDIKAFVLMSQCRVL